MLAGYRFWGGFLLLFKKAYVSNYEYNKCPNCNSRDLIELSKEEYEAYKEKQKNGNVSSSADELLKFKQLLDAGVITQEEFDAKKKQLLGI